MRLLKGLIPGLVGLVASSLLQPSTTHAVTLRPANPRAAESLAVRPLAARPLAAGTRTPPNSACVIKGNISRNNGRKLYHLPGMKDYDRTVIDTTQGERWFCSEDEAIQAGWTKAPE